MMGLPKLPCWLYTAGAIDCTFQGEQAMGREQANPKKVVPRTAWKKGQSGNPKGKPPGTKNKLTRELKQAAENGLAAAGAQLKKKHKHLRELDDLEAYIAYHAATNGLAGMGLIGKMMPQKIDHEVTMMTEKMAEILVERREKLAIERRRAQQIEDAEIIEEEAQSEPE